MLQGPFSSLCAHPVTPLRYLKHSDWIKVVIEFAMKTTCYTALESLSFTTKPNLQARWSCKTCGHSFSSSSRLKTHLLNKNTCVAAVTPATVLLPAVPTNLLPQHSNETAKLFLPQTRDLGSIGALHHSMRNLLDLYIIFQNQVCSGTFLSSVLLLLIDQLTIINQKH